MIKTYKTEIKPTEEQKEKINKTMGVCRYVYNLYLYENKKNYENGGNFISGYSFSKWLNNEYIQANTDKKWIKEVSSKAVKQSIMNAEKAYKRFFKGVTKYPRYKTKRKNEVSMYFVRNSKADKIISERHRIKIPTLGYVRLKEKGYIPSKAEIKAGAITKRAGRYFVSVSVEETPNTSVDVGESVDGIGVDLGIKNFAITSEGKVYKNINRAKKVKKLEKKIKREQKRLSRKQENKKKGEATLNRNIQKQREELQRLYYRIDSIRTDYINKVVSDIVKAKPSHITIENLNVSGMIKNRHLSKAIAQQKFREFRDKLTTKAKEAGIELRIADRFYPSTKRCSRCGSIKRELGLSERVYRCEACGMEKDRDENASINLRDCDRYEVA